MSDWFDTLGRLDEPRRLNPAHDFWRKSKSLNDTMRSYVGSDVAQCQSKGIVFWRVAWPLEASLKLELASDSTYAFG